MALSVGQLAVELEAKTQQFQSAMQDIDKRVAKLERDVEKATAKIRGGFSGVGGAASGASRQVGESSRSITRSLLGIGPAVTAITAGLTGLAGVLGTAALVRFATAGVQSAAAFEQTAISLRVLTGDAAGAAAVLSDVEQLVLRTPFGLAELANTARSVAVIFGDNADRVREFTGIAADLASAFGRPVEQIGENLSRAFSAGLGSADVFREAGITAEILRITGATEVAAVSSRDLAEALRKITSEGGKASGAAAAAANSLGGAISNTEIGFSNLQRTLGQALSPALVDVLVNIIQPALLELGKVVRDNSSAIGDTFVGALLGATQVITSFVATLAQFVGFLGDVGVTAGTVGTAFSVLQELLGAFFTAVGLGFRTLKATALEFLAQLETLPARFRQLTDSFQSTQNQADETLRTRARDLQARLERTAEEVARLQARGFQADANTVDLFTPKVRAELDEVQAELARRKLTVDLQVDPTGVRSSADQAFADLQRAIADAATEGEDRLGRLSEALAELRRGDPGGNDRAVAVLNSLAERGAAAGKQLEELRARLAAAQSATEGETGAVGANTRAQGGNADALDRRTAAQERLRVTLERDVARGRAGANISGLAKEILALDEEITKVKALKVAEQDRALQAERLAQLTAERTRISGQLENAERNLPATIAAVNEQIAAISRLDSAAATGFATDLQAALVSAANDPAAQLQAVAELSQQIRETFAETSVSLGDSVAASLGGAFLDAADGAEVNLADRIGRALFESASTSLENAFADAVMGLGDLLDSVLSSAGSALSGLFQTVGLTGEGGLFGGLLGEGAGQLLGDAAVAAIGTGLQALSRDDQITSTSANVRSAVDSAERVRGIVAGPTNIAVAQVDRAISDAFIDTNQILAAIERNTRGRGAAATAATTGSVATGGTGPATVALGNEGPSLF